MPAYIKIDTNEMKTMPINKRAYINENLSCKIMDKRQRHIKCYIHTTITSTWRLINSIQFMHKWGWKCGHYQTNISISLNHDYNVSKTTFNTNCWLHKKETRRPQRGFRVALNRTFPLLFFFFLVSLTHYRYSLY